MKQTTRRRFLQVSSITAASLAAMSNKAFGLKTLQVVSVDNPLESYPDRKWEDVYRDQYKWDRTFTYCCSPNDTHQCRVRAFVRNGIVMRVEQPYDHQNVSDLYGNKATRNWNPRMCLKGYTYQRRLYGANKLKHPMMRKGWKRWADDGFPALTKDVKAKYKFDSRGSDTFLKVSWDDAFRYAAKGYVAIAKRYSGEGGAQLLRDQGYDEDMIKDMGGAGTRCLKFRGGMGLLGVIGIYGLYRVANGMALLDDHIRKVGPKKAKGGRSWSNYTWHGDQAPGHPWTHGLQTSDIDFNDIRFSKLTIQVGKNLIENKMPESHWMNEIVERGGKIVTIVPEYSPPCTKADYFIPIRAGLSDTALFLCITKILMDEKLYDADFVKKFTDFPLLVRTDTLKMLQPQDIFRGYKNQDISKGLSYTEYGLKEDQRQKLGDFVVWDTKTNSPRAITRDDVGNIMKNKGINPALEGVYKIKGADGKEIVAMPVFQMYKVHLQDYDLDTTHEICGAPKHLIKRLAYDIATIKPVSIHYGEGINHWFHATLHNRATYLPLMLTGNIGIPGSGSHTWAGNYKAANFQASKWSGPGFKGWIGEDPFNQNLDPNADGKHIKTKGYFKDEEPAYWNHGDKPLVVDTPKYGRKNFTGWTHMPTPTKALWFANVNLFNNAKHHYEMFFNINPNIEMIMTSDIELNSSGEYSDIIFAVNGWMEKEKYLEITSCCSNPFTQVWGMGEGVKPIGNQMDDLFVQAGIMKALSEETGDKRMYDLYKFVHEGKPNIYLQRLLDGCSTYRGYNVDDVMKGKYGTPGSMLTMFRTYPRNPFYEQIYEDHPFPTNNGRMQAYSDNPTAIECGENFIVHREGVEGTPYLPNVIVSNNPYIRPDDFGISPDAEHWDDRTIRNIKMPWGKVRMTKNFLWEKGYSFFCITPKTRHRVHSQWGGVDWHNIWDSNFGDPYRMDKRSPGVGEHQMHMNPLAAMDLGIKDGDYVYVDANPADRPYMNWKPSDPHYKVARLMLRVKYNPAYPYAVTMMKHAPWCSTERSVKAHESRSDGRALSADTGYQANLRYGSQQSLTRNFHMPMHQTDTLFHKKKVAMAFLFGGEADNHAINTVPKETLVKVTKAEDGGLHAKGVWEPATTGFTPSNESPLMKRYLAGGLTKVKT